MKNTLCAFALTAAAIALPASASNFSVNFGAIAVMPNDSSSSLNVVEQVAELASGSTQAHVNDNVQLGLSIDYAIAPNWSLELIAATPFTHDIQVRGSAINGLSIGKTKHLPPTLLLQYHFDWHETIKPFIGLGVNYTVFFDEETSEDLASALTALNVMQTGDKLGLSLSDSWGIAAQVGVNMQLTEKLGLHLSASKMKIDTRAQVKLNGTSIQKVDVTLDPLVTMVGLRFTL